MSERMSKILEACASTTRLADIDRLERERVVDTLKRQGMLSGTVIVKRFYPQYEVGFSRIVHKNVSEWIYEVQDGKILSCRPAKGEN